jgi:hypothetical protein
MKKRYQIQALSAGTPWVALQEPAAWKRVPAAEIDCFPWHVHGLRQRSAARVLRLPEGLALEFVCEDAHSFSQVTRLNGPVWEDSCVEFFFAPLPEERPDYFNFEVNACGSFLLGFGPDRNTRRLISIESATGLRVCSSLPGPTKLEEEADREWRIVALLPFAVLEELCGALAGPTGGTRWTGNFHRCGGRTDPQYACWSPINAPRPDFHRPEDFGGLVFD